jgi:NAD(P)-dependent dehydrogenase (short-subunit alcohol dehydrogenase family)
MPAESLAGRTALVTGAARRIGRAIAIGLAREGVNVLVHYRRSVVEAENLAEQLRGIGVQAWPVQADFQRPAEYETLVQRSLELAGSLDILVNSAAVFTPDTLAEATLASLVRDIEVNAWVPFALGREFATRASRGSILNLLDSRLRGHDYRHVSYILSKHLLAVLTEMMAVEFAPGVRVNAIAPGLILPPPGQPDSYLDKLAPSVPLRRHGGPEDIVEAALCLLRSDFVTGQVIFVDGGRHLKEYGDEQQPG